MNFNKLCRDVLFEIFSFMSLKDLFRNIERTCKEWRNYLHSKEFDEQLWKSVFIPRNKKSDFRNQRNKKFVEKTYREKCYFLYKGSPKENICRGRLKYSHFTLPYYFKRGRNFSTVCDGKIIFVTKSFSNSDPNEELIVVEGKNKYDKYNFRSKSDICSIKAFSCKKELIICVLLSLSKELILLKYQYVKLLKKSVIVRYCNIVNDFVIKDFVVIKPKKMSEERYKISTFDENGVLKIWEIPISEHIKDIDEELSKKSSKKSSMKSTMSHLIKSFWGKTEKKKIVLKASIVRKKIKKFKFIRKSTTFMFLFCNGYFCIVCNGTLLLLRVLNNKIEELKGSLSFPDDLYCVDLIKKNDSKFDVILCVIENATYDLYGYSQELLRLYGLKKKKKAIITNVKLKRIERTELKNRKWFSKVIYSNENKNFVNLFFGCVQNQTYVYRIKFKNDSWSRHNVVNSFNMCCGPSGLEFFAAKRKSETLKIIYSNGNSMKKLKCKTTTIYNRNIVLFQYSKRTLLIVNQEDNKVGIHFITC